MSVKSFCLFVCLFVGSGRGRYYDPRTASDKKCRQTGVYVMNGTVTSIFDTFSEHFGYPYLSPSPVTLVRVKVKVARLDFLGLIPPNFEH